MATEPEKADLRVLREMRAEIADVRSAQEPHSKLLGKLDKNVEDIKDNAICSLGLSASTFRKEEGLESRLDELAKRVTKLEERVP